MELVEPIETINETLKREFGLWEDGRPRFRVVWSEDQKEKIISQNSDKGIELLFPEVVERPKYMNFEARYVLEQLSVVPEADKELTTKTSYEPLWVFQDKTGKYLPPRLDACLLLIRVMYENVVNAGKGKKYSDEEAIQKLEDLKKVEDMLFGNETPTTDALKYGWGVTVPGMPESKEIH